MKGLSVHEIWFLLESAGAHPALYYVPGNRWWHFDPGLEKSNGAIRESAGTCGKVIPQIIQETWEDLLEWFKRDPDRLGKQWQHLVIRKETAEGDEARIVWNGVGWEPWSPPRS